MTSQVTQDDEEMAAYDKIAPAVCNVLNQRLEQELGAGKGLMAVSYSENGQCNLFFSGCGVETLEQLQIAFAPYFADEFERQA
jgi:hypothetical protein